MPESPARDVLPIPEPKHVGLTTYDAKDPATSFPPMDADHLVSEEERFRIAMARQ